MLTPQHFSLSDLDLVGIDAFDPVTPEELSSASAAFEAETEEMVSYLAFALQAEAAA